MKPVPAYSSLPYEDSESCQPPREKRKEKKNPMSFYEPFILFPFLQKFYYEFFDSMDLKWCIGHPVRKKRFVLVEQST
jgi:hypothetical protein